MVTFPILIIAAFLCDNTISSACFLVQPYQERCLKLLAVGCNSLYGPGSFGLPEKTKSVERYIKYILFLLQNLIKFFVPITT
jgi:hypothetical protein